MTRDAMNFTSRPCPDRDCETEQADLAWEGHLDARAGDLQIRKGTHERCNGTGVLWVHFPADGSRRIIKGRMD